jgi:dTDP-4-amino-4,6-dideoxygalactose transaminase
VAPIGPHVNAFEEDICKYTGANYAAVLSCGTAALHLALIVNDVQAGDEVLCQSMTFSASANAITYQGAKPVFIDSEEDTWNMSPEYLVEAIKDRISKGKRPKAIVPVHLYGMPAKMEAIMEISRKYEIPVIEDAAESLGATLKGRHTGTFSPIAILSFNGNKIITTSSGGALITEKKEYADLARFLATQARDNAPHYQHSHIGYNYRMSNVLAGIGRGQMIVLPDRIAARRKNFARYQNYFAGIEKKGYTIQFQPEMEGSFSNRWLTSLTIDPKHNKGITREDIRLALEAENIEARPLWKPMHLQPIFKGCAFYGDGTSERLFENGLCMPSGSNLSDQDFERIFEVLDRLFM